jgi:CRP/FNR family transcriptional regulator
MKSAPEYKEPSGPSETENTFAFLPIEDRVAFCGLSPVTIFPTLTELFTQGSPSHGVFCLHSGLAKLINLGRDGDEFIVGLRSSGWILGAAAVMIQEPYPVTAVTVTPCCLHFIPSADFRRLVDLDAEFARHLLQLYSREVYDQTSQMAMLGTLKARQRLERLLAQLIPPHEQNETRLKLPLKFEEVAQLIAVKPEHLSRVLKQLEDEGLIRRDKGWIIVSDPQRLFKSNGA